MANIGYVRVSTKEQNTGRQTGMFADKGIKLDKSYEEKVSGKNTKDRPQLKAMLEYVREGDVVYVESFSRIARNIRDLLDIVDQLQAKQVEFVSFKENVDTTTPQGRFMLVVFGALAELEREQIHERQREGIELALAEGRPYGRPKAVISNTFSSNYGKWKAGEIKAVDFMKLEGLKKATFYKLVKQYEADQEVKSNGK